MRKLLFSVFFLSAIAHRLNKVENDNLQATCGQAFLQSGPSIKSMNTNTSSRNEAPFTVQIRLSFEDSSLEKRLVYSRSHCTGTIISPRHVLTAAHCFALNGYPKCNGNITQDFVPVHVNNGMKVAFKLNYFIITAPTICNDSTVLCDSHLEPVALQPKRVYLAKSWMNHFCSKPVNGKIRGDVAVMELEDDIVFSSTVQSACIHATRPSTGQVLFLYGYGVDSTQYLETAGILRKYQGTTLSEDKCKTYKWPENYRDILNSMYYFDNMTTRWLADDICTRNETTQPCFGDSGSGFVFRRNNKTFVTSVAAFGPMCLADLGKYPDGLATFSTSLSHHMNWIRAVTGIRPDGQSHMEDEDIETLMKEVYVIEQHPSFAIEIPRPFPGNEN